MVQPGLYRTNFSERITMDLSKLKEPMPFHWKVQAFYPKTEEKQGCICVGYIDARQVTDRLDEVLGPENWQCTYSQNKNNLFCTISVRCGNDWIGKSDCGTESDMEAEKGEASDAFKRAAVRWGVGRFLYELPEMKLKVVKQGKSYAPADDKGNALFSKDKLTEYCNSVAQKKPAKAKPAAKSAETPKAQPETNSLPAKPTEGSLPAMSADQKKRMARIFKCVQDNYANGKNIEAKDFAKAVYVILTHWPDCAEDEETVLNTIHIGTAEGLCGSDGKQPSVKVA